MIQVGGNIYIVVEEPMWSSNLGVCSTSNGVMTVTQEGTCSTRSLTMLEEYMHAVDHIHGMELSHQNIKILASAVQQLLCQIDADPYWFERFIDSNEEALIANGREVKRPGRKPVKKPKSATKKSA